MFASLATLAHLIIYSLTKVYSISEKQSGVLQIFIADYIIKQYIPKQDSLGSLLLLRWWDRQTTRPKQSEWNIQSASMSPILNKDGASSCFGQIEIY